MENWLDPDLLQECYEDIYGFSRFHLQDKVRRLDDSIPSVWFCPPYRLEGGLTDQPVFSARDAEQGHRHLLQFVLGAAYENGPEPM